MTLPPASSVRSPPSGSGVMRLLEDDEDVALLHRLALLDADLLDGAGVLGLDGHLHLHRLEDHHRVALVDLIAGLHLDLPARSGDVGGNVGHWRGRIAPLPEERTGGTVIIGAARDEADRIAATIEALKEAFPDGRVIVGDDGSRDGTSDLALAHGAEVVSRRRAHGKGGSVTAAVATVEPLTELGAPPTFLLCDGDLGASARELRWLVDEVEAGECDL